MEVPRATLIERMTDAELAVLEGLIKGLPLCQSELWRAVSHVWSDDARVLAAPSAVRWSEDRVGELLALDPGAELLPD